MRTSPTGLSHFGLAFTHLSRLRPRARRQVLLFPKSEGEY